MCAVELRRNECIWSDEARPAHLDFTASSDGKRQGVRGRFSSAREHDFASARWPSDAHGKQWGADGLHDGAEGFNDCCAAVASASSHSRLTNSWLEAINPCAPSQKLVDLSCATFKDDISRIQLFAAPPSVAEVVFKMNRADSFLQESLSEGDWTLNASKTANVIAMRVEGASATTRDWQRRREGFEVWLARRRACSVRT